MSNSKIEWTQKTWNPITGCTKVSEGCKNCYAERMSTRLQAMGQEKYANGFNVTLHPETLEEPLRWKKPSMIFVCSMSDLFHKDVPDEYIFRAIDVMRKASHHTFQVLTKRSTRLMNLSRYIGGFPKNVWAGVSVEDHSRLSRIDDLRVSDACTKFVSFEPLLSWVTSLNLSGIDWAIVGGESGYRCRDFSTDWARTILGACRRAGASFFMKQLGGHPNKRDEIDYFPPDLRIREYPE